jgi:hypothetical protein
MENERVEAFILEEYQQQVWTRRGVETRLIVDERDNAEVIDAMTGEVLSDRKFYQDDPDVIAVLAENGAAYWMY